MGSKYDNPSTFYSVPEILAVSFFNSFISEQVALMIFSEILILLFISYGLAALITCL